MENVLTMTATTVVFILGIIIGYRLKSNLPPITLPKKENIPITKEYRDKRYEEIEEKKRIKQFEATANYIEKFGEDD